MGGYGIQGREADTVVGRMSWPGMRADGPMIPRWSAAICCACDTTRSRIAAADGIPPGLNGGMGETEKVEHIFRENIRGAFSECILHILLIISNGLYFIFSLLIKRILSINKPLTDWCQRRMVRFLPMRMQHCPLLQLHCTADCTPSDGSWSRTICKRAGSEISIKLQFE